MNANRETSRRESQGPTGAGRSIVGICVRTALLAGLIAILINTALLHMAEFIPLKVQGAGLFKGLKLVFGGFVAQTPLPALWAQLHLPAPESAKFKFWFHAVVGLVMAVVYAALLEPRLPGPAWVKGLLYALLAWLLNAFVLLPAIGEGVAGVHQSTPAGIAYYGIAHTVFFVLMAVLYARLRPRSAGASTPSAGLS